MEWCCWTLQKGCCHLVSKAQGYPTTVLAECSKLTLPTIQWARDYHRHRFFIGSPFSARSLPNRRVISCLLYWYNT
ncbi:Putative transferase CAF17-like protein, mitochondrial [Frankliniella fusca]|uniref:Transferase CAF17-like protein, mitochondrial n=1 Tax=Frankliniella fusca TaxID=407009 RepID=A0AAE1LKH6_9NEOP|nr:Putative transferase CAF17-like protein, mitochondrial [Frankliniella fusca]